MVVFVCCMAGRLLVSASGAEFMGLGVFLAARQKVLLVAASSLWISKAAWPQQAIKSGKSGDIHTVCIRLLAALPYSSFSSAAHGVRERAALMAACGIRGIFSDPPVFQLFFCRYIPVSNEPPEMIWPRLRVLSRLGRAARLASSWRPSLAR
jgi:hypothetical protein